MVPLSRTLKIIFGLIILCALFVWAVCALNYTESAAVGTYSYTQPNESGTLRLSPDHTFQQRVTVDSKTQTAQGTWFHFGEAHLSFSSSFIPLHGEEPAPDGERFGEIRRLFGLFVNVPLSRYNVLWYGRPGVMTRGPLLGTYVGDEEGIPATLTLNADRSFSQAVTVAGTVHHVSGHWSETTDGDIAFSSEFLTDDGNSLRTTERAATAVPPTGGPLQIMVVDISAPAPVLWKKYLPW